MIEHVEARAGAYADSVTLMQVSRRVSAGDGVEAALVAMGTPLNLDLALGMGFTLPANGSPDDLLVAIRARDDSALAAALAVAADALTARPRPSSNGRPTAAPRTVGSAARDASALALISVPGQHAFTEAMDALDAGCDVMIFSDNVPVEQEVRLKSIAGERGLLVMGPDCGTAVVGGVGLGFSHTVEPGSTLDGLAALDADPATELIVVVSKPPAAEVARHVRERADALATPVQFAFLGEGQPDLTEAAEAAIRAVGGRVPEWPHWPGRSSAPRHGVLRGLFAGGTLCDEAMVIAAEQHGEIRSNIPLRASWRIGASERPAGHSMIDFGDDELTAGRPHPMIDQSLRLDRFAVEAADPTTAVILLDIVLGHGAHPDPARELAPAIASAPVPVVVSLIGARADPQDFNEQASMLQKAGAHVFTSNAQAARFACGLITR